MSDGDREHLLELLEKYGRNLHSFMVLEPGLRLWLKQDAAVAYVQQGGYWVAVGSPICSIEDTPHVVTAFREAAARSGHKVVFFAVTENFIHRIRDLPFDSLQVGMVPTWDPSQWKRWFALRKSCAIASRKGAAWISGPRDFANGTWPRVSGAGTNGADCRRLGERQSAPAHGIHGDD